VFETESRLNQFLRDGLKQVVADIPADRINERALGNGHPPLGVLGPLAIGGRLGQQITGTPLERKDWAIAFGPGSSDDVRSPEKYSADEFLEVIEESYPVLSTSASQADPAMLQEPHGLPLLNDTAIVTKGDLIAHLLTSHFGFHLAQLSAWRRGAGFGPLF